MAPIISSTRPVSRLHRLLTLINAIKTNPHQTPAALWKSLGIGKTMFYKDKAELAGLGFAFEYLVFERNAELTSLLPHECNVLFQNGALRRFGPRLDLHVVEERSEAMERLLRFFQRDRRGMPVGIVEVLL